MLHIAASAMTPADISWDFIIGGLALFLFGIQFMGDGLKSIAGEKLREYIDRYTNKPWKGILVGSIITVFIQSSSATSAIAIGFVRAGLMSLEQSIGIIIGANIGTTVTAFLIGLKVETLALYFVFLGVLITLFAKRKKQTYMGQIVLGFGLLFFGLRLMGDELSKLGQMDFFTTLATTMQNQPILGFISGTLMTAVVQSSSAVVGIIQKIYDSGAMTLTAALPFVFGSNIGTTVTAVFASIGGSTSAKRSRCCQCSVQHHRFCDLHVPVDTVCGFHRLFIRQIQHLTDDADCHCPHFANHCHIHPRLSLYQSDGQCHQEDHTG